VPAWALAQTSVDQKRPAAASGKVTIENMSGSVKVTGWDRAEVQVKGTLGDGAELGFDGGENRTSIEVEAEHGNPMGIKSDLEVFVPAGSSVSIEGFAASISVAGVTGSVSAETVNGSITQSGAAKGVELQSVNGAIEVTKAAGRIQAEAVNGTVTVRDASGELEASTVNGKLLVTGGSFDRAALESVSGGVRFEAGLSARATLSVESVSGSVELFFPAGFGAEFSVSTFSGTITNELGPAAEKSSRFTPEKELSFTAGSGGARVTVETLSGAVSIRKR
jgi:DUF4097 and DUF4098 domain-containing protein YvlB